MKSKFVSRAGEKLEYALDEFDIDVSNFICADFGSSTGGFVDCLLKKGADKVYSVDTSYGELDWNLRNNAKVVVMERTNAIHVVLPEKSDLITIDTGWTKQEKIIPNAMSNLKMEGSIITLIKPHYEAPDEVKYGLLPEDEVNKVVQTTIQKIEGLGMKVKNIVESPIEGKRSGNKEYLALITF